MGENRVILVLQETNFKPQDDYKLPGYNILRPDKLNGQRGGTALLIPNEHQTINNDTFLASNLKAIYTEIGTCNKTFS